MIKNKILLFVLLFSFTSLMITCKKKGCTDSEADNYCSKCKSKDGDCLYTYAGSWSVTGNCGGSYSMSTAVSGSTLTLSKLGNCYTITGSVSGKTLTISSQTVNASTSTCGYPYTIAGSGTFSGDKLSTLKITYTVKDNSGTIVSNCSITCTKK